MWCNNIKRGNERVMLHSRALALPLLWKSKYVLYILSVRL